MSEPFDLCIIGGGIIGCSAAYYAARAGVRTVLFERGALAGEASGLNPGTVALVTKVPGDHALLARASLRELSRLDRELGGFDYVRAGSLVIFETAEERDFAAHHAEALRRFGVDVSLIDKLEARRIQPILEGPILGALWSPQDCLVSARKLTLRLAQAALEAGADIRETTPVTGAAAGEAAWEVRSDQGMIRSRWLVNAAGVDAPAVGKWLGLNHAVFPRKGQLMATSPVPEAAPVRVTSVQELLRKQNRATSQGPGPAVDIGLTPQPDGSVFLGGTQERVGLDRSLDPSVLGTMALKAGRLFPRLTSAAITRAWCGFRPATADGHPLVGTVASCPRYLVASGHGGDGVALAPITGRYVADAVAQSGAPLSFGSYAKEVLERGDPDPTQ